MALPDRSRSGRNSEEGVAHHIMGKQNWNREYRLEWVSEGLDFDDWSQLEPLFEELDACSSTKDLPAWIELWSELESAFSEEESRRYVAMTCDTRKRMRLTELLLGVGGSSLFGRCAVSPPGR